MRKREHILPLAVLVLFAFLIFGISEASADASLTSSITVKNTTVKETANFTVTMLVTNTGTVMIPGVRPSALQITGAGRAVRQAWPKPAVAAIAPGAMVKFSLPLKAMLAGDIILSGNAISPLASSSVTSSPTITVTSKKKTQGAALTDYDGYVPIKVGNATLRMHFTDETTGSPVSGLSVAVAMDKKNKWRAVVAAVDGQGRYPIQIRVLQGPSTSKSAEAAARVVTSADPPAILETSIPSGCDADELALLGWSVNAPIETLALPLPPPSPTPASSHDLSVPMSQAIGAAQTLAFQTVLKPVTTTEVIPCEEALKRNAELITTWGALTYFGTPIKMYVASEIPVLGYPMIIYGAADTLGLFISSFRDYYNCGLFPSDNLMIKRTTFPAQLPPALQIIWDQPVEMEPDPSPLYPVAASITDPFGQPLTTGSLEYLHRGNLGAAGLTTFDADGKSEIRLPPGDYSWRVARPGFKPSCGVTSVTQSGATVNATLQTNSIASGSLRADQLTGFLSAGTTFNVTPTFADANGNPVACGRQVFYQVNNPVGTVVATVDQSGNVTVGAECGAARVTAWCSGVQTGGVLVSTDCNGTLPAIPPATFAVSPASLSFTATEGGANPPTQILAIVQLSSNFQQYSVSPNAAWVSVLSPNPAGAYPVSIDISGMKAGTYKTTIDVTDLDAPANHQSVAVTLKILPAKNGGGDISGTWVGTWTLPTNYAFSPTVCNNLQNKTESGTMTMSLSTQPGSLPSIFTVTGTVSMSGLEAASVPCGGGTICNSCSWVPFSVSSTPINSLSMWANITNQALIFADVSLPPSGPPLYLAYPIDGLTFNGTYANGRITGTFNSTGTFSVTKQ